MVDRIEDGLYQFVRGIEGCQHRCLQRLHPLLILLLAVAVLVQQLMQPYRIVVTVLVGLRPLALIQWVQHKPQTTEATVLLQHFVVVLTILRLESLLQCRDVVAQSR